MKPEIVRLLKVAESCLAPIARESGKILYSSSATLRPGPLYILGLNPGGDPNRPEPSHCTIREAVQRLVDKPDNDFIDEVWQGARRPGSKPLQRRMQWLCSRLTPYPHLAGWIPLSAFPYHRSAIRSSSLMTPSSSSTRSVIAYVTWGGTVGS